MQFFLSYKCHRLVSLALTRNEEIWSLSTEAAPTMSWIIMVINAISSRLPHDNCPIYKSIAPGKFLKSLPWLEIWLSMVVLVHLPSTYIMHLIGLVHLHLYIFLILHCLFLPCSSQFFFSHENHMICLVILVLLDACHSFWFMQPIPTTWVKRLYCCFCWCMSLFLTLK